MCRQFNGKIANSLIECHHIWTNGLVVLCVLSDTDDLLLAIYFSQEIWFNQNHQNMIKLLFAHGNEAE